MIQVPTLQTKYNLHTSGSAPSRSPPMILSSPTLPRPAFSPRRVPTLSPRRASTAAIGFGSFRSETRNANSANISSMEENSNLVLQQAQSYASPPSSQLGFRRGPELGLGANLFVISMVGGSFISMAAISLPVFSAFRRLTISMDKLSTVVSEEVPGTLSSLKLSGLEINDLTSQLEYLRQRISGSQHGKKAQTNKKRSRVGKYNPSAN